MTGPIRVLHSLDSYLPTTQNWIHPQVASVPDVDGAVICSQLTNTDQFPTDARPFFLDAPDGVQSGTLRRITRAALRRSGHYRRAARAAARAWRPALVHAHFGTRGWATLPLVKRLSVPLVTTFYGVEAWSLPVVEPEWQRRFAELFHAGDLFLVEGPAMRARLVALGCPVAKVRVRRLGVDAKSIRYVRRTFAGTLKIAMIGRFIEKKGFVDGLQACASAAAAGVDVAVVIVGDASDAEGAAIKRRLHALANETALRGRVTFTGFLDHVAMRRVLEATDVLLCPSRHAANGDAEGGMPFVLAEAMAMGVLGIGSRHCDMGELIVDGETGRLFDEGNIDGLSEVLCEVNGARGDVSDLTTAARAHIEARFDVDHQLAELAHAYRSCLAGR